MMAGMNAADLDALCKAEGLTPEQTVWAKRIAAHLRLFGKHLGDIPPDPDWAAVHRAKRAMRRPRQQALL